MFFGSTSFGSVTFGSGGGGLQSDKLQPSRARIQVTAPAKTITGTARIQNTTPQTQAGTARIQITTPRTQTGVARIQTTGVARTITGKASIVEVYLYPWRFRGRNESSANFANRVKVLGAFASATGTELTSTANDIADQTARGRVIACVVVNREIDNQAALDLAAAIELEKRQMQETITFDFDEDDPYRLEVGEVVKIVSAGAGINGYFQCQSLKMTQKTPTWTVYSAVCGTYQPDLNQRIRLLEKIKKGPKLQPAVPPPLNSVTGDMLRGATIDIGDFTGNIDVSQVDNLNTISISSFSGNLNVSRITSLNTITIASFSGNLDVSRVTNLSTISVSSFTGNLDVSRVNNLGTITIASFTGNLDVSRVANLGTVNINSFSGSIGTLNAGTVVLTGQWSDSHISAINASKITAGTISASVTMTSPTLQITSGSFVTNIDSTNGVRVNTVPSNQFVAMNLVSGITCVQAHNGTAGYDAYFEPMTTRWTTGSGTVCEIGANPTGTGKAGIVIKDSGLTERFSVIADSGGSKIRLNNADLVNTSSAFVGAGVDCNAGIAGTGFNIHGGSFFGQTGTVVLDKAGGGTWTLQFVGGIVVSIT